MALQRQIVVCVFVIVRNVVLVWVNNFKIFVSVVSEIISIDRVKPIFCLQVTTDIGRACSGSDMIRLAVVNCSTGGIIYASIIGGIVNIMVAFFDQMDLAVFLYRLPIPRVIAVQILQQEVGGIIIGAAILCLGKRLASGIRHVAQPAIDTLAEHLCQITGRAAGVANIVVIVVKQLGAHDIPHVIGAIVVPPLFRQRLLHVLRDIPNRFLRINRLLVCTEHRLDKVRTNIAPIKRLHRAAVQSRLRRNQSIRCIAPLSVLRHLCSVDIHSLKMGGRRGVQQGIPLGVTVVINARTAHPLNRDGIIIVVDDFIIGLIALDNILDCIICVGIIAGIADPRPDSIPPGSHQSIIFAFYAVIRIHFDDCPV